MNFFPFLSSIFVSYLWLALPAGTANGALSPNCAWQLWREGKEEKCPTSLHIHPRMVLFSEIASGFFPAVVLSLLLFLLFPTSILTSRAALKFTPRRPYLLVSRESPGEWIHRGTFLARPLFLYLCPIQTLPRPEHAGLVGLSRKVPHSQPNMSTCSELSKQDSSPVKIRPWASEHKDPKWQNRFIPKDRVAHHFHFLHLWAALVSAPIEAFSQFSGLPKFFCLNEIMPFAATWMAGSRDCHTEWSQSDRERETLYDIPYL